MPKKISDNEPQTKTPKKRRWRLKHYQRADHKFEWRAKAPNGNVVSTSGGQGYDTLKDSKKSQEAFFRAIIEGRIIFEEVQ